MELHLLLIAPVILLGLTIGSFLNVVIFRLPRDLSVRRPRWSFCPACAAPIRAIDNVPVWSWLRLGGRCRQCKAAISLQYPVVELLTAVLFLAVYDALVIGRVRWDVGTARIDALVVVAYWVLFACLLANAVMDIEEYIIDVRLTYFAATAGILLNAAWRTAAPAAPPGTAPPLVLAAAGAGLGWLATAAWLARRARAVETPASDEAAPQTTNDAADAPHADGVPEATSDVSADVAPAAEEAESAAPVPSFGGRAAAVMMLALSLVGLGLAAGGWPGPATGVGSAWFIGRCVAVMAVLTFVLVLSAMLPRRADEEIVEAIAAERPSARRQAWREALALLPAASAGAAGMATALRVDVVSAWVTACSQPLAPWYCRGLAGAADAAAAMVGAAALGWAVRIGFTLALGKEAYGVGDIHFMAAIGAVAGFWTCLIGFFLASLLALCGAAAMMFRKSCRVLPFGPWLGLGALAATWVRDPAAAQLQLAARTLWNVVTSPAFGPAFK